MAGTRVVVELTPDEDRLLRAFRKATAEDEKMRASFEQTGETGEAGAKQVANAWIKAGKQTNTTLDKMFKSMRRGGGESKQLAAHLEKIAAGFETTGREASQSFLAEVAKIDPELAGKGKIFLQSIDEADKAEKFESTRRQLDALGGDFSKLAGHIKLSTATPLGDAKADARKLVDQLLEIDPAKSRQIAKALGSAADAIERSHLEGFISQLSKGSDEARELASLLGDGVKDASLKAEGGIDVIIQKVISLRPELASTVDKWRVDMAEAAKFGEGKYKEALDALRAGDKISKQVAEEIKKNLVTSGKIVEKQFEDMLGPLRKIDPLLANQAMKSRAHFEDLEKRHKGIFARISQSSVAKIGQVAAAYFGVQEAIQAVTTAIQEQQDALEDAADAHRTLATAQQEAAKNLSTLNRDQRQQLLEGFVPKIAAAESFPDLANLTKAVGDARSAGASVEQLKEAVSAAAAITGLTTEFVDETAAALVDVSNATGNINAKQNVSQLFVIGSEARIVDPQKLFRNVSPVLTAGATIAGPERAREAALQGGAVFASLTRAGADPQGDASQTATIQFMSRMDEFFKSLGKDATKAQAELDKLKKSDPLSAQQRLDFDRLSDREGRKQQTDARIHQLVKQLDQVQARQDEGDFATPDQKRQVAIQKRKLQEQLQSVRKVEFDEGDAARLEDLRRRIGEADREFKEGVAKLEGKIAGAKIKGFRGRVPETPKEQIETLVRSGKLREAFLDDKFGEQRFRPGFQQLVSGGVAFRNFQNTLGMIERNTGSTRLFDQQVREDRGGTRAKREAFLQRQAETNILLKDSFDTTGAALGRFRDDLADSLEKNRSTGLIGSTLQSIEEIGVRGGTFLGGEENAEELLSGIERLETRIFELRRGGVSPLERERVASLERSVENALSRAASQTTIDATRPETFAQLLIDIRNTLSMLQDFGPNANKSMEETLLRVERIFEENLRLQREGVKAAKETAGNTKPSRNRAPVTNAMPVAAGGGAREGETMITIDGLVFDNKIGIILAPEPDAIPFRSSTSDGTGIQVTETRGPGFTLTLTHYDRADEIIITQQQIAARIGKTVRIIDYFNTSPVDYLRPLFGTLQFRVTQARTIEAELIPGWYGYRFDSTPIKFQPACRVVSQWTMYAIKV